MARQEELSKAGERATDQENFKMRADFPMSGRWNAPEQAKEQKMDRKSVVE